MISLQPKTMRRTGFHGCDPFAMRGEKNKADKTPILPLEKSTKTLRLPMAVLFISMGFVTKNKT
ncbi:hypothetical protein EPI10_024474 [Gossypium australe]|uniref:Uncharacterized protein n=1 Tax=Gossypium australe TaxID=47621 RepID=A0A5B6VYJ8_9ROSI|nr:hypothetical protein EPI10_024474 [Gossypium australe]